MFYKFSLDSVRHWNPLRSELESSLVDGCTERIMITMEDNWQKVDEKSLKNTFTIVTGLEPAIPRSEVWCLIH